MTHKGLIILDRDGVLNKMVIDSEHGTIDSPLHPSQVTLAKRAEEALRDLSQAGFLLAVASNQPAWAKGKTTKENLLETHRSVIERASSLGGRISESFLCLHRSEDQCLCRKPKPGLLLQALKRFEAPLDTTWMVGDGVTDVEAGIAAGTKTAFLGPKKCDHCKVFEERGVSPDFFGADLFEFSQYLLSKI